MIWENESMTTITTGEQLWYTIMTHLWWKSKAAAALLFAPTTQWHSWHLPSLQVSCSTVKPMWNFKPHPYSAGRWSARPTGWVDGLPPLVQSSPLHEEGYVITMLSQLTVTGLHTHRYEYSGFDRPFNDFSSCSFSRVEWLYSFLLSA